jgi:hypothetical protein
MRVLAGICLLILAGCGPSLEAGNDRGGIITGKSMLSGHAAGFKIAEKHCKKYGRKAEITSTANSDGTVMTFKCVK